MKSNALFSLIKSLSKSEKRYFKLFAGFQGKGHNYMALFNSIDQMEGYDESFIRNKFSGDPLLRQLHVTKNYLSKLILKSLKGYHMNESLNAKLKSLLLDIEILFRRDLLDQCYKSICKAEKLAQKADDYLSMLEILGWKRRVLLNMKSIGNNGQLLGTILTQEQTALKFLTDENQYWSLTVNISGERNIGKYRNHPYLKDKSKAQTRKSKILYYHLLYVTHIISGNFKIAEESIEQLLDYLESDRDQLRDDPSPYITAINNKIGLYLNQKQLDKVPPLLEKIRATPEKLQLKNNSPISMKLMIRSYNVELETYRDSGQIERGINLIPTVRSFLDQKGDFVPNEYYILFHYQFAYLFFMSSNFKSALRDINVVLNHRYQSERADIVGYAQFLNLIIHYELGNITVLKYAVNTSRRFLKKRGKLMEFERILLNLFSNISTRPESHHKELFEKTFNKLFTGPDLISDSQLDYLDFNYWIGSKLKTHPLNKI